MESICKTLVLKDETVKIPRLHLEELFGVCEEIVAERMAEAERLGKADRLDKLDISNIKLDLKLKKVSLQELMALTNVPQVASKVIRAALKKAKFETAKQTEIIAQINIQDAILLARDLVLDEQEEPVKEEVKVENPLPGDASSATAAPADTSVPAAYGE
jgi:hypothetical protein